MKLKIIGTLSLDVHFTLHFLVFNFGRFSSFLSRCCEYVVMRKDLITFVGRFIIFITNACRQMDPFDGYGRSCPIFVLLAASRVDFDH